MLTGTFKGLNPKNFKDDEGNWNVKKLGTVRVGSHLPEDINGDNYFTRFNSDAKQYKFIRYVKVD